MDGRLKARNGSDAGYLRRLCASVRNFDDAKANGQQAVQERARTGDTASARTLDVDEHREALLQAGINFRARSYSELGTSQNRIALSPQLAESFRSGVVQTSH